MDMPINLYDAKSAGAESYMALADEVIEEKGYIDGVEKRIRKRTGFIDSDKCDDGVRGKACYSFDRLIT